MKNVKALFKLLFVMVTLHFNSCSSDSISELTEIEEESNDDKDINAGESITYVANVKSIIDGRCLGCHSSPTKNGAPFSLVTFSQVKASAENGGLFSAISRPSNSAAIMPPSGKLPQSTIDIIEKWIDDGLLE